MDERLARRIDLAQFVREIDIKCWDRLAKLSWRPFEDARDFSHSLKLKSFKDWVAFTKGHMPHKGKLPRDIPAYPNQTYASKGWKSYGDWLGTGTVAPSLRKYRPFREARDFTQKLKLRNEHEWRAFCKGQMRGRGKLPRDIPASPARTYADLGWKGMGDWLGTGNVANFLKEYRPFCQARAFAQKLKLKNGAEWFAFCKGQMPAKGKMPRDIPVVPSRTYSDKGWQSMGDWLGTGNVANFLKKYRPFREARAFVRKLEFNSEHEWRAFYKGQMPGKGKLPEDIPTNPNNTYADTGWKGMGDWLGTKTVATNLRKYRPFQKARAFARSLKLISFKDWVAFTKGQMPHKSKLPTDIPAYPNQTYASKGWKSYGDWLGTGTVAPNLRKYRSFHEARVFAQGLELNGSVEWSAFCKGEMPGKGKLPEDIPACPSRTYSNKGWKGFGDWLGTGTIAPSLRKYRSFHDARTFVKKLKLKGSSEWRAFCKGQIPCKGKLPRDIPAAPNRTYADEGWTGLGDWLGTERAREPKQKSLAEVPKRRHGTGA